ncbi:UDP-N-acetylmuramoyl-L-alanyl-D-glutamate--2,6-diaminopimelate ligase, partial [Clostridioides difficile]|nr:UDP-N-acetylmuramoyl-L-alanyl-D-glutamate--2,6-diaminopimelate ligase [Clostridioides difficile]
MKLNDIIQGLDIINVKGELNIDINNVQYDSRKVTKGTLFICIKGFVSDGHKYIKDAIEKGASAFLVEEDVAIKGCTFIKVKDTRKDMAKVADNFYNHPSQKFNVIGVTGTNGKTSITTILNEILTLNKNKVGLIGTIKIFDGEKDIVSNSTTP